MIPLGTFDPELVPAAWLTPSAIAIGNFSRDLVDAGSSPPPFVPPTYLSELQALTWLPNVFTGPEPPGS